MGEDTTVHRLLGISQQSSAGIGPAVERMKAASNASSQAAKQVTASAKRTVSGQMPAVRPPPLPSARPAT